jgi:trimeric autotransporter adhesin
VALLVCTVGLYGCGAASHSGTTSEVTLKSLSISPPTSKILVGASQQFTVTGYYSNDSQRDLTASAKWTSVQPTIATISSAGMAVTLQAGKATITAASGSVSISATLTVSAPSLVSLSLSPSTATIAKGDTQQFTVTGTFNNQSTKDLTSQAVWGASAAKVASINSSGLATARTVGTTTITVTSGSASGTGTLTVTPPVLTAIAITPADSSIGLGTTEQLSTLGTFSDGSTQDLTASTAWASARPGVATIAKSGLATSWSIGTAKVTGSSGGFTASGTIAVLPVAATDYFSNAHNPVIDGTLTLVNTGLTGGDLCAMVYVFDSSQEMNECCGCPVSQDAGMKTLSIDNDLTSNTLTGVPLTTGVIRVIPADLASNPTCNAGTVTPAGVVMPWSTHIQLFAPGAYSATETESQMHPLNKSELTDLESDCAFIQKLGSGHGICTCGVGD